MLFVYSEYVLVIIRYKLFKIIPGTIYLPPSSDFNTEMNDINGIINSIKLMYPTTAIIIGGDFNARVSNLSQLDENITFGNPYVTPHRNSFDPEPINMGKKVNELMECINFILLNGRTTNDSPAQYTLIFPRGSSVIDLVWTNLNGLSISKNLEVKQYTPPASNQSIALRSETDQTSDVPMVIRKLIWKNHFKETH